MSMIFPPPNSVTLLFFLPPAFGANKVSFLFFERKKILFGGKKCVMTPPSPNSKITCTITKPMVSDKELQKRTWAIL